MKQNVLCSICVLDDALASVLVTKLNAAEDEYSWVHSCNDLVVKNFVTL